MSTAEEIAEKVTGLRSGRSYDVAELAANEALNWAAQQCEVKYHDFSVSTYQAARAIRAGKSVQS